MSKPLWPRLARGLYAAAYSGFPWPGPSGEGHSDALRRALRRSVIGRWPVALRWAGATLMILLWPAMSLHAGIDSVRAADRRALGARRRLGVLGRAWAAALRHNLPPVDYVAYRLFEPGRPGPGRWLHSADAHLHFAAIAAPQSRVLVHDKLAFADLADSVGAPAMPTLAAYGPTGVLRGFDEGTPPPIDLIVKPRRGHGAQGLVIWRWEGARHVASDGEPDPLHGPGILKWLSRAAASNELLVQEFAAPPDMLGGLALSEAPILSILTAEWPDRRRAVALALLVLVVHRPGGVVALPLEVDLRTGRVDGLSPGTVRPIWRAADSPPPPTLEAFTIPGWSEILAVIDRVHAALPGPAPVLKWDLILTDRGPRLLEANIGAGVYGIQAATLRPLTETAIGDALEAWAR